MQEITVPIDQLREYGLAGLGSWEEAVRSALSWKERFSDWYKTPHVFKHNGMWCWYGIRLPEAPDA